MQRILAVAGLILTLAGCASLSEDDCKIGDWQGIGVVDGKAGYTSDKLNQHAKACSKYNVTPDVAAYMRGRTLGLQSYCTPSSGFEQGRKGRFYRGVCPVKIEERFKLGYALGREVYSAEGAADEARSDLRSIQKRISKLEKKALGEKCAAGKEGKPCRKAARRAKEEALLARTDLLLAQTRLISAENQFNRVSRDATSKLLSLEPVYNPS